MSEKQFDMFDERFREAAEQHDPPFDEASWTRLEARLDADKKRRRPLAWWWWLTDAGILALLVYLTLTVSLPGRQAQQASNAGGGQTERNTASTAPTENNTAADKHSTPSTTATNTTAGNVGHEVAAEKTADGEIPATAKSSNDWPIIANSRSVTRQENPSISAADNSQLPAKTTAQPNLKNNDVNAVLPGATKTAAGKNAIDLDDDESKTGIAVSSAQAATAKTDLQVSTGETAEKAKGAETASLPKQAVEDSGVPPASESKKSKDKSTRSTKKGFYVYGNIGPEWSFVKGSAAGKSTLAWGLGLGYQIAPRWSVQAGYFSTTKLYDAGPGAYKPKPGTYYYNLTINRVAADCRITEIPLVLNYTAIERKKHALSVGLGLSSMIMNKEEYHYNYLRANSSPAYAVYNYETHNSHLFASVLLTAGYQFKISKSLSVSAAPYFKVPLYGVGEGSIKIYSYGLMAGARYDLPFFRK